MKKYIDLGKMSIKNAVKKSKAADEYHVTCCSIQSQMRNARLFVQ